MFRAILALLATLSGPIAAAAQTISSVDDNAALTATISALDTKLFDAYNRCDLAAFGSFFSPSVEFYHDKSGATFDRATVVANTRRYICHKVRRELVEGTLHVYPIKEFGAIAEGEHRFCQINGPCDGVAKFLMIWRKGNTGWQLTRVISFGHRALTSSEQTSAAKAQPR